MKKEMGLSWLEVTLLQSFKTKGPSFSKGTGLNIKEQEKVGSLGRWVERNLTLAFIYLSLPFLAPGKEKGRPTPRAHNAPPGTLKKGKIPFWVRYGNFSETWQCSKVNFFGPLKGKQQLRSYLGLYQAPTMSTWCCERKCILAQSNLIEEPKLSAKPTMN